MTPQEWPNYQPEERDDSSQAVVGKRCRLRREQNTLQAMANDLGFEINLDAIGGETGNDNAEHGANLRGLFRFLSADTQIRVRRSRRRHIAGANVRVVGASAAVGPLIQYPFVRAVMYRTGWNTDAFTRSRRPCGALRLRSRGRPDPAGGSA